MPTPARSITTAPIRRGGRTRYTVTGPDRVRICTELISVSGEASALRRTADALYEQADRIEERRSKLSRIFGSLPIHDVLNGEVAA